MNLIKWQKLSPKEQKTPEKYSKMLIGDTGPLETVACCSAWKDIRDGLSWYAFLDHPGYYCMPSIGSWRVNHCPSCGADVRMSILWRAS